MMKWYIFVCLCIAIVFPSLAKAADGSSGNQFYEMVFGNPDQRKVARDHKDGANVGSEVCDGYGGLIGGINGFFCHMEKDMGVTGPGSATKAFGTLKVHAEIVTSSTTINSVTYDTVGTVWFCNTGTADCSLVSNFVRMYYIAFSYNKSSGVNKGYALLAPGIMEGQSGSALEIIYDLGSASATQSIQGKAVFAQSTTTYKMRILGTKTASSFKMNVVGHDGTNGFRFALSGAPPSSTSSSNYYNMYYEGSGGTGSNGFYSIDAAGLAAPATANGMCMLAVESGSTTNMTSGGSSCTSFSFQAFDYYAATASGSPSAQGLTASGILGTWQGMAANPSAL